ncbi:Iron-sulfur cluster insertion protein ErpA [Candidatus Bealeia paramacronuclearis]|uniref:Iron-sulfur cluster insertion protein ErpA n=1 Tax=Candidatus Bealeia paramacronuclearis TaxID=1921001 RepID=A0ABZ2C113_9PROT|nr:Iron-sulfur cluster insertion protein ErpA [Candidatus Bealeia paramacronuclearis]
MNPRLTITESAAKQIAHLISEEKEGGKDLMLRLTISGGGCSGFQYGFSLDNAVNPDDEIFESQGVKVIADEASLSLLEGSQIDYHEDLMSASFVIKNPNASSSCGCGNSFSV